MGTPCLLSFFHYLFSFIPSVLDRPRRNIIRLGPVHFFCRIGCLDKGPRRRERVLLSSRLLSFLCHICLSRHRICPLSLCVIKNGGECCAPIRRLGLRKVRERRTYYYYYYYALIIVSIKNSNYYVDNK